MADNAPDWAKDSGVETPGWAYEQDVPDHPPLLAGPSFREREHAFRKSIHDGDQERPAGQDAAGPDLSGERLSGDQLATQWSDVAKGAAKGAPAALALGLVGDIESGGRHLLKEAGVGEKTLVPTTTEGGLLGPRGIGVMNAAATPQEAAGMQLASMLLLPGLKKIPGAFRRGEAPPPPGGGAPPPKGVPQFEMHPEAPIQVVRPDTGARLLTPDVPHTLPPGTETIVPRGLGRTSAGAEAVRSVAEDASPNTLNLLKEQLEQSGFTPWTLEARLEEMSPHHMLFEVDPNMVGEMQKLGKYTGESKNTVVGSLRGRAAEAVDRMRGAFDDAFGEAQNLSVKRRELSAEQRRISGPFWDAFTRMEVPPTPALDALTPRLRAAGAFGTAKRLAALEGKPWTNAFEVMEEGNKVEKQVPTPASYQLVKEALDSKIENSFNARGEATKMTRAYTQLKNDLIDAIDNHPDSLIGAVWKAARDTWAGPAQLKSAHQLGKRILNESIDPNELPFMLSRYSNADRQALAEGIRADLENKLGRPGPQNRRVMNQVLSDNNKAKIREVLQDDAKAQRLFDAIEHEHSMHDMPSLVHGNSQTANRMGGNDAFAAQPTGLERTADVAGTGVGLIMEPKRAFGELGNFAADKFAKGQKARAEAAAQQLRNEMATLYTLQGPERDAVLRWLIGSEGGFAHGGAVKKKASGGALTLVRGYADGGTPDDDLPVMTPEAEAAEAQAAAEAAAARVRDQYSHTLHADPRLLTFPGKIIESMGDDVHRLGTTLQSATLASMEELHPGSTGATEQSTDTPTSGQIIGEGMKTAGQVLVGGYEGKFLDPFRAELQSAKKLIPKFSANAADTDTAKTATRNETARQVSDSGFYSHGAEAAQNLPQEVGTPQQMRSMLEKAGVKKEEFDNANWDLVFGHRDGANAKPMVSKQEIATLFNDSKVPVQEVWHEGEHINEGRAKELAEEWVQDNYPRYRVGGEHYQDAVSEKAFEIYEESRKGNLRYDPNEWTDIHTPGGTNHRELLLTLPQRTVPNDRFVVTDGSNFNMAVNTRSEAEDIVKKMEPHSNKPLQIVPEQIPSTENFKSTHWDEPNILAHVRMQDQIIGGATPEQIDDIGRRMAEAVNAKSESSVGSGAPAVAVRKGLVTEQEAADWSRARGMRSGYEDKKGLGKKTLLVDELQSDWHQLGRKNGYVADPSKFTARPVRQGNWTNTEVLDQNGKVVATYNTRSPEEALAAARREGRTSSGVPDAPFKSSWSDLAMKRVLKYAADNGYDQVAWTAGKTQAERYDLSKKVSKIAYNPESGKLWGFDKNGATAIDTRVPKDKLAEHIGKDAAEKLLASQEDKGWHSLNGTELQVDAPGMTGFYDKILPTKVNSFVKKHGSKVEEAELPVRHSEKAKFVSGEQIMNDLGIEHSEQSEYWRNLSAAQRERLDNEYRAKMGKEAKEPIHVVPITDSLREDLSGGVRMFANAADKKSAARNEVMRAAESEIDSRVDRMSTSLHNQVSSGAITEKQYTDGMRDLRQWEASKRSALKDAQSTASASRPVEAPQHVTQTPEFKNWFGDSKVVDAKGEPLVVYHGGSIHGAYDGPGGAGKDFAKFSGEDAPYRGSILAFFTTSPKFAADYAGKGTGSNIKPVYLKVENPFDFRKDWRVAEDFYAETGGIRDNMEANRILMGLDKMPEHLDIMSGPGADALSEKDFIKAVKSGSWDALEAPEFVEWLRQGGHDGIVTRENKAINYAVFEPTQIKSATGNRGAFDPENPNILYSNAADEGSLARNETIQAAEHGLHETPESVTGEGHGRPESHETTAPAEEAGNPAGGPGGDRGLEEAQRAAETAAGVTRPLDGLPQKPIKIATPDGERIYVPGPIGRIHQIAEDYMRDAGLRYKPLESYQPVKVKRAERIGEAYGAMKHDPDNPAVKASYDAMIDETVAQLKAVQKSGLKIEFIKPGMPNPYEETPRLAHIDVRDNNHLWVFPTEIGFGTGDLAAELANNPLLRKTGISIDGHELVANDAFRIVHDYFGHLKDGVGFRADGEENAWRSHVRMYSPAARGAMTSETRGQNSWLNYGPHGEKNRTAKSADTIYADQKTGLMPGWTATEGAADPFVAPRNASGSLIVNAGNEGPVHKAQTVADPHRMMYPGIYEDPRRIAREAAQLVAPEDIQMKKLWGVSRGDLDELAKGRVGNEEPRVSAAKNPRGSLAAQNIQTPKNTQRLVDILAEAGKHPGLRHADAWYIMDPVYQRLEHLFGPEEAKQRYERFNTLMAMASPSSPVLTEIQRGSAAHHMAVQGRFEDFLKHAGTPREWRTGPSDLSHVEAHPYHRTSQAEPMAKYLEHGRIMSEKPKVPLYAHASGVPETGFQTAGPVPDAHFSRGIGLTDTRKGPGDVGKSASRAEYQTLQPWWRDEVAGELGLEAVPAQARLWTALAPRTGVESAVGAGKLELLTRQIVKAARRMGTTPEKARDLILSGKASAGALAAFALGMNGIDTDEPAKRASGGRVIPFNINRNPSEAQQKAGNYAKEHLHIHGLPLTIENAKGSIRRGVDKGGKAWQSVLPAHYGYIKKSEGADGDHVDIYLGPHPKSPLVFVIDQIDASTGKFDEHKAMLGFGSEAQAKAHYIRGFSDGKGRARIGRVHAMTVDRFKAWLRDGDTKKPFAHIIPESEKRSHATVGYVAESKIKARHCSVCAHYIPGVPPGCEGVKSPIAPMAYCRRFKPAK